MSGPHTRLGFMFFEWHRVRPLNSDALKVWMVCYTRADIPGLWSCDLPEIASRSYLSTDTTLRALDSLRDHELVEFDRHNRLLRLTEFPDAGEWPQSPNMLLSWWRIFSKKMPSCEVRNAHVPLLRWLVDEGPKQSERAGSENRKRPSDKHEEIWAETFSTVTVPITRTMGARTYADADTSTAQQPSLFGVRGGMGSSDPTRDPIRDGIRRPHPVAVAPVLSIHKQNRVDNPPWGIGSGSDPGSDPDRIRDPSGEGEGEGEGSDQGPPLAEVIVLDPSSMSRARPIGPTAVEAERDRQISLVVRTAYHEHVLAFARVKAEIESRAPALAIGDDPHQLRELVRGMGDLGDALERCRYAIEVRELEAKKHRKLIYFGHGMWKRDNFDRALVTDLDDLRETPPPNGEPPNVPTSRAPAQRNAFAAANRYFDQLKADSNKGNR